MTTFREFLKLNETSIEELLGKIQIPNEIPTIKKQSPIASVELTKNPIAIYLADGTKLFFTWDEFKRISGDKPCAGKTLYVVMERHPKDTSLQPSKIVKCHCH